MKTRYVQYFAEGEDERKIIDVLKTRLSVIKPWKVLRLNVVEQEIKMTHLRTLACGTMVVLVFDTDTESQNILIKNIKILEECPSVSEIVLIPQIPNLEGELIYSCNIVNQFVTLNVILFAPQIWIANCKNISSVLLNFGAGTPHGRIII